MAHAHPLTEDTIYKLLSNARRIQLLSLLQQNGTMDLEDLAAEIAAREEGSVDEATQHQITVSLVHNHLPLLADHNVVQHDRERGTVALLDVFDEFEQYLDDQSTRESILQKLVN